MEPAVWIPIVVGIGGLLLASHQFARGGKAERQDRLEKLIEEKVEMCIADVVSELRTITAKLNNGVVTASREHTKSIAELQIDVAKLTVEVRNLTGQVERVIVNEGK